MHDWTGSRARTDALTIACPYCHAPIGEGCRTENGPLIAFPAHISRIRITEKSQEDARA